MDAMLDTRNSIQNLRDKLGSEVLILAHHYQSEGILTQADIVGDSFLLAQEAARSEARFLVLCGVHFMGETADLLSRPEQTVLLPRPDAGCPLADCADADSLELAWSQIPNSRGRVIPITYVNSSAEVKAFCGRHGGATCTSSSAAAIFAKAFTLGEAILFLPDQNLGQNVAHGLGYAREDLAQWNQLTDSWMGNDDARVWLWDGGCCVHERFTRDQIEDVRTRYPDVQVIVHPECHPEVVQAADEAGSTEYIRKTVLSSSPGSSWAIGTEINLVEALQRQCPDRQIISLIKGGSPCKEMHRIKVNDLRRSLQSIVEGNPQYIVKVSEALRADARAALDRMLEWA